MILKFVLASVAAFTMGFCFCASTQAQVGDYPPPAGETSWEEPIKRYWHHLPGSNKRWCVEGGIPQGHMPQSPIAIKDWIEAPNLPPIQLSYNHPKQLGQPIYIINRTDHGLRFDIPTSLYRITIGGVTYRLKQFHFHHPSEHTINNMRKAMELHLVHEGATPIDLAVIAVLLQQDETVTQTSIQDPNFMLHRTMRNFREFLKPDRKTLSVKSGLPSWNFEQFLPTERRYVTYNGSLTTPNCLGNVTWIVFTTPVKVNSSFVDWFKTIFGTTARWPQDLRGRQLKSKAKLD